MNEKKLKLGLPKGSLQESTMELFRKAGWEISNSARSYFPNVNDPELEIMVIRAQEIPRFVEDGVLDCGITGKDWIIESKVDVTEVAELLYAKQGLSKVKWVLAVPNDSKINSVKDLEGKRISTELVETTKEYLKRNKVNAAVEFSWGATEAKCPKLVDAIVELTETGNSLRANNLRIVDVLLESSTRIIANNDGWKDSWKKEKIMQIKTMLESVLLGKRKSMLEMNVSNEDLEKLIKVLPCMKSPTIAKLYGEQGYAIKVAVDKEKIQQTIALAKKNGATDILEFELQKVVA